VRNYISTQRSVKPHLYQTLTDHLQVLIADDRIVICGSANLNDRSQLGTHDSEIAIVVEDQTPVNSSMNGQPWQANRFAASLRRQLFRKHLGLLRPQDMQRPDANFDPVGVPNSYDWGSPEDNVVADPLSDTFQSLWNSRARQNTDIFRQVFRAVPDDNVRNWNEYKEFYEYYFKNAGVQAEGKQDNSQPSRYLWGHIVREDFPPGPEGIKRVKDLLSRVKGTLVEMPLVFLMEETLVEEGLSLNDLTEVIYT
jgi:phospholipase D1/2